MRKEIKEIREGDSVRRRWTAEEDAYIRQRYGKATAREIATVLGRSLSATRTRARRVGAASKQPDVKPARAKKRFPKELRNWLIGGGVKGG